MKQFVQKVAPLVKQNKQGLKLIAQQVPKYNFMSHQSQQLSSKLPKYLQKQSLSYTQSFNFSKSVHNVPEMGDSITEGTVLEYKKKVGEYVLQDETFAIIETDKVQVEIKSPNNGLISQLFAGEGDTVEVGKPFFELDTAAEKPAQSAAPAADKPKETPKPAETPKQQSTPQQTFTPPPPPSQSSAPQPPQQQQSKGAPLPPQSSATTIKPPQTVVGREERREPMSRMRQKISERLKESQNTYALLTTFQECDMSAVMEIRNKYQPDFQKKHGVKLGFMSFFIKAATHCLQTQPVVNAVIDGKEIVYRNYVDISVAVATPNGLMVPVLRNCENQGFADIEKNLIHLADKGKKGKITLEDMAGGTFTISNGGVFGSMMGTPILNPPQSAILGMHSIINRPVVRNDQIVARPMMYLALTYDHRLIDGREAATFLKQLATEIEDPRRILLDL